MGMKPEDFQSAIVTWFRANARDLPWRRRSDPYAIWISEIMLQQTTVATVIPYFERFLAEFPTLEELARARETRVIRQWEGLGYYSRARNLHRTARILWFERGGEFPRTREELLELPGIGPYTAGAILSIGHGIPSPALDGNLIRIYARLFAVEDFVNLPKTLKQLWALAERMTPKESRWARDFTEGMMELGATICKPQAPFCLLCPVNQFCEARKTHKVLELPKKKPRRAREIHYEEIYVVRRQSRVALLNAGADVRYPHFSRLLVRKVRPFRSRADFEYPVTHRLFRVRLKILDRLPKEFSNSEVTWLPERSLEKVSLPAVDRRILRSVLMK